MNFEDTVAKIQAFQLLPVGWHFGEGIPPCKETASLAIRLAEVVANTGFQRLNAFLGTNGEIRVTAYHNTYYLECTLDPEGPIALVLEGGNLSHDATCALISVLHDLIL